MKIPSPAGEGILFYLPNKNKRGWARTAQLRHLPGDVPEGAFRPWWMDVYNRCVPGSATNPRKRPIWQLLEDKNGENVHILWTCVLPRNIMELLYIYGWLHKNTGGGRNSFVFLYEKSKNVWLLPAGIVEYKYIYSRGVERGKTNHPSRVNKKRRKR